MRHICILKTINKKKKTFNWSKNTSNTRCYILSCATYHDFHDKGRGANKEDTEPGGYGLYSWSHHFDNFTIFINTCLIATECQCLRWP